MTDDDPSIEGTSAVEARGNFLPSELALGQEGRTFIKSYERHSKSYDKTIVAMHQDIIGFGRVLLIGKEMYPSPKEFGYWVERRGLNTGKLAKHQTERTACMSIARLVDHGAEIDEDDASIVPVKLDLTGCKLTTPTDIMKWARQHHRHLFPHLPPKQLKPPGEKIAGDIKRELNADIAARDERTAGLEAELDEARARIAELEAANNDKEQLTLAECVIMALERLDEKVEMAMHDDDKADLLTDISELFDWGLAFLTTTKDGWYGGITVNDFDYWYNEPKCSYSPTAWWIEPIKTKGKGKNWRITGYRVFDPNRTKLGEAKTLAEAKQIAAKHGCVCSAPSSFDAFAARDRAP